MCALQDDKDQPQLRLSLISSRARINRGLKNQRPPPPPHHHEHPNHAGQVETAPITPKSTAKRPNYPKKHSKPPQSPQKSTANQGFPPSPTGAEAPTGGAGGGRKRLPEKPERGGSAYRRSRMGAEAPSGGAGEGRKRLPEKPERGGSAYRKHHLQGEPR